jgi:integrase
VSKRIRPDRPAPDGRPQYQVEWREGGRKRSRLFRRSGDADAFDLEVRRRRQLGPLAGTVIQSQLTLAEFLEEEWWPRYAIPNLAADTRRRYLEVWASDLLPRVGGYQLRELTPLLVEDLRDQLAHKGLSAGAQRKALLLLSGILKRAVVRGLIPANPVSLAAMPKTPPASQPQPLAPELVERIRRSVNQRGATLISLMAYAGLRPSEARNAHWADLHDRTLHVYATKTSRPRDVDLLAPLAQDLAEWRLASGRPANDELVVPRPSGGKWGREDWANWRERVWRPAAQNAGVTGDLRPYRLRSSFVSLLLWSGEDLAYIADQAGHSIATLARHYAGVMKELKDQPRVPAADAIRRAREAASGQLRLVEG